MSAGSFDQDELYGQAVAVLRKENTASTSLVSRRLNIGYSEAMVLVERMQSEGVVTEPNSVGRRELIR